MTGSVMLLVDYHALAPIVDVVHPAPMVRLDERVAAQLSCGQLAVGSGDAKQRTYYYLGRRWWT